MKLTFLTLLLSLLISCSKERVEYVRDDKALKDLSDQIAKMKEGIEKDQAQARLLKKKNQSSLVNTNRKNLTIKGALEGHTKIYPFKGKYRVLVIPVQFSDAKFTDPGFFNPGPDGVSQAQDYLFGGGDGTMTTYYKHSSIGKLQLSGEVTDIVTVSGKLADYGEAVARSSDKNARGLVVHALKELMKIKTDQSWWLQYDTWDLSDYDKDLNFHEPDGFIDSVVLIYAGKSQASCQASFDPDGKRPPSSEVPRTKA